MGDFSRDTYNKLKHYVGVRMQQGVPLIDADWNEMEDIRKDELQYFLENFVGNGIPKNNDGFHILPPTGAVANDFLIKGGAPGKPGCCIVQGRQVLNEADILYTDQLLFPKDGVENPATKWGVAPLAALTVPASVPRTDLVYLDVWEREVDSQEDTTLKNPAIGLETCVRIKREWVVRVAEGTASLPATVPAGHVFYAIGILARRAGQPVIAAADITDSRKIDLTINTEPIFIKNNNVGIGIMNPTAKLEVAGDIVTNVAKISDDPHGADCAAFSHKNQATATGYALLQNKDGDTYLNAPAAKSIRFRINNEDKVFLKSDGNVGIGTTDPAAKLEVNGNVNITSPGSINFGATTRQMLNLYGTSYGIGVQGSTTYFRSSVNFAWYQGGVHDNGELNPGTGGTALMAIKSGNVGIGTTAPAKKLHVVGDSNFEGSINVTGSINIASSGPGMIPAGGIIMWSGAATAIPSGWALCNGTNGTPDLRGKFILGYDNRTGANVGNTLLGTGGSSTVTLTAAQMASHDHTVTINNAGTHSHNVSTQKHWRSFKGEDASDHPLKASGGDPFTLYTNSAGDHSHTTTVGTAGSGTAHDNMPPYYALCFIMKT